MVADSGHRGGKQRLMLFPLFGKGKELPVSGDCFGPGGFKPGADESGGTGLKRKTGCISEIVKGVC